MQVFQLLEDVKNINKGSQKYLGGKAFKSPSKSISGSQFLSRHYPGAKSQ